MIARIGLGLASIALACALVLGFRPPDDAALTAGAGADGRSSGTANSAGGAAAGPTADATQVVDGTVIQTRFGPVQVEITVSSGRVVRVSAVELPAGGRSGAISRFVSPILASEALSAQSARIDVVSGATYTSRAYATSLQAALDSAGL